MAALARGRRGRWAPVINTALFATYHFSHRGGIPLSLRCAAVSIAAHMTINIVTVLLLAAGLAAGD